jgi:hypothetical protein
MFNASRRGSLKGAHPQGSKTAEADQAQAKQCERDKGENIPKRLYDISAVVDVDFGGRGEALGLTEEIWRRGGTIEEVEVSAVYSAASIARGWAARFRCPLTAPRIVGPRGRYYLYL